MEPKPRGSRDSRESRDSVSLRPRDAMLPKPFLYLLFDAKWHCLAGGVVDSAFTVREAAYLARRTDELMERAARIYIANTSGDLWTGYAVLPLDYGGVQIVEDEDRYMSLEQLKDVEALHAGKGDGDEEVGTPIALDGGTAA